MNKRLSALAAALALCMPMAGQAQVGNIKGDIEFSYSWYSEFSDRIVQKDDLEFDEPLFLDVPVNFAVAAAAASNVGASVVAQVGSGWMRFSNVAYSAILAAPADVEIGGSGQFRVYATVTETVVLNAPGQTGRPGSAELGFWVEGVVSAASDAYYPGSAARSEGYAYVGVEFRANGNTYASTGDFVRSPLDPAYPDGPYSAIAYNAGGIVNFTYGTPFDVRVFFDSEGLARASSDYEGGLPGSATLVSDFGNTITWAGVANLRDVEGNPVTDFTAFSSDGTDFRYAISAPSAVPEPATVLLFAVGLAALGWRSARAAARGVT